MKPSFFSLIFFLLATTLWWYNNRRRPRARPAKKPPPAAKAAPRRSSARLTSDPFTDLLKKRLVRLTDPIDDGVASMVIAGLILLESEDPVAPIILVIDSDGGSVPAALAIFDTMERVTPPVHTICRGRAFGMAALILASGHKGERRMTKQGRIGFVPLNPGATSREMAPEDWEREVKKMEDQLVTFLMNKTGQPEEVMRAGFREMWSFGADEAREYGVIDEIVSG